MPFAHMESPEQQVTRVTTPFSYGDAFYFVAADKVARKRSLKRESSLSS